MLLVMTKFLYISIKVVLMAQNTLTFFLNFAQKCDLAGGQHVVCVTDYFKLSALTLNGNIPD